MKHDIIVIGGGPAGLSFASSVADTGLNVAVIEKSHESILADPPYDGREIALTHLARKTMQELGMWDLVGDDHISMIKTAKVLNGDSPYALSFDHEEAGEETLGFMISNNRIRKSAYESLAGKGNVELMCETEVSALGTDDEKGWVELKSGEKLEAKLIVAADSRFSAARRAMGVSVDMLDFGRTCIVGTLGISQPHEDTAYECFHFDRTLAILPLNNNQVSFVITLSADESDEVLAMSAEDFSADVERRIEGRYGEMTLSSERFPYPLMATFAKSFCAKRFALIGDAAVGMHPVTAHGFNLGLRGAHSLANEIKASLQTGGDFAAQTALENYSRKHTRACLPLYHGTNALVKLYTEVSPPAKFARRALLRLGNRLGPAKRLIMNQLTETKEAS